MMMMTTTTRSGAVVQSPAKWRRAKAVGGIGVGLPSKRRDAAAAAATRPTRGEAMICRAVADHSKLARLGSNAPEGCGWASVERLAEILTTLFPVWVCLGVAIGIARPAAVTWFTSDMFTVALGFLMLSMGLTLTFKDFQNCLSRPIPVLVGFMAQYMVMPALGFYISKSLGLSPALATGLILVSSCPGGQSSNVATYIARGDVALSVLMTTASTLGAIVMTPFLTKILAGTLVPVNAMGLAMSTMQVVLVPTLIGVLANELMHRTVVRITPLLPLVGVVLTTILTASPVGQAANALRTNGFALAWPAFLLHGFAFPLGYFISRACRFSEKESRTVSIETGMQSSALGFLLAQRHFSDPMVAVPSAVSVIFQAGIGSALAILWRNFPPRRTTAALSNVLATEKADEGGNF